VRKAGTRVVKKGEKSADKLRRHHTIGRKKNHDGGKEGKWTQMTVRKERKGFCVNDPTARKAAENEKVVWPLSKK